MLHNDKLREEWRLENDKASYKGLAITESGTADWFLSKFAAHNEAVIKKMKLLMQDEHPTEDGVPVETYGYEETYNKGVKDSIALLKETKE